jgi:hypothetical protein
MSASHQFPASVRASVPASQVEKQTVFDLVSVAQGWHERAVVLRLLSFHVSRLFAGDEPQFLVRRISGSARPANEAQVAAIASELRDAAADAQAEAERILGTALEPVDEGRGRDLGGRWAKLLVRTSALELEDLDACALPVEPRRPGPAVVLPPRRF